MPLREPVVQINQRGRRRRQILLFDAIAFGTLVEHGGKLLQNAVCSGDLSVGEANDAAGHVHAELVESNASRAVGAQHLLHQLVHGRRERRRHLGCFGCLARLGLFNALCHEAVLAFALNRLLAVGPRAPSLGAKGALEERDGSLPAWTRCEL